MEKGMFVDLFWQGIKDFVDLWRFYIPILQAMREDKMSLNLIRMRQVIAVFPELIEVADLVTEMKEIKHYYNQGVPAREGIEF